MSKFVCQECGQELTSATEYHDYFDCEIYKLRLKQKEWKKKRGVDK